MTMTASSNLRALAAKSVRREPLDMEARADITLALTALADILDAYTIDGPIAHLTQRERRRLARSWPALDTRLARADVKLRHFLRTRENGTAADEEDLPRDR